MELIKILGHTLVHYDGNTYYSAYSLDGEVEVIEDRVYVGTEELLPITKSHEALLELELMRSKNRRSELLSYSSIISITGNDFAIKEVGDEKTFRVHTIYMGGIQDYHYDKKNRCLYTWGFACDDVSEEDCIEKLTAELIRIANEKLDEYNKKIEILEDMLSKISPVAALQ